MLLNVAVTAEYLLRQYGVLEALVGEDAFDDGREQAHVIVGGLAGFFVVGLQGDIALERGPQHQRARRLVEGAHRHQHAADVGVHDDRIGGLLGRLHARDRAPLQAVLGVLRGVLIGDLGEREALDADAEARLVHHHEHRVQAAVRLADEPAGRLVVIDDAGRVAVNAHLLFDRAAGDPVRAADAAIGIDFQLRRHEQ